MFEQQRVFFRVAVERESTGIARRRLQSGEHKRLPEVRVDGNLAHAFARRLVRNPPVESRFVAALERVLAERLRRRADVDAVRRQNDAASLDLIGNELVHDVGHGAPVCVD